MVNLLTLQIIADIVDAPTTTQSLLCHGIGPRQLSRHIEKARDLGADIECDMGPNARWRCNNAAKILKAGKLQKWLVLARDETLL